MRTALGILLILASIFIGLYVGVYYCFIGGIVGIIEQVKLPGSVDALTVAWSITKILVATPAGAISWVIFFVPGLKMVTD